MLKNFFLKCFSRSFFESSLRRQAQRSAAAGMSDAEVEAEIAVYRSSQERSTK